MSSDDDKTPHRGNEEFSVPSGADLDSNSPDGHYPTTPPVPHENLAPDSAEERQKCPPVTQAGTMTPEGYKLENSQWLDQLTRPSKSVPGARLGRNPLTVDPPVLTAAGHPPRGVRELVAAKTKAMGEWLYPDVRSYKDIPLACDVCADGEPGGVIYCALINCPFWAYRNGKNPHSPRRGKLPEHLQGHTFRNSDDGEEE